MARVIYLDCFSGAAGDMLLAALIDAGLPIDALRQALGTLGVDHRVEVSRVVRAGIGATYFSVDGRQTQGDSHPHGHGHSHSHETHHHHHDHESAHRTLAEIDSLIEGSALSAQGKARAVKLFRRLGEAEAAIHQIPVEQVHLHEVGALDSIIDIVGAVFALEWFGIEDIVSSPLNVGAGSVHIAHGTFPVPAPATLRLLTGVPVYSTGTAAELVTPTGALLVSDYARSYGPMPGMKVERIGYGAGTKDLGSLPNVLRVVIGERTDHYAAPTHAADVVEITCEIDDMNPQLFGPVMDKLLAAGALDAYLTPIQMKKGRPGTLLTVLTTDAQRAQAIESIFAETTTIGLRFHPVQREVLDRRWDEVAVSGGVVRIKVATRGGQVMNAAPEFDDCIRLATTTGQPVKAVQAAALRAWYEAQR